MGGECRCRWKKQSV